MTPFSIVLITTMLSVQIIQTICQPKKYRCVSSRPQSESEPMPSWDSRQLLTSDEISPSSSVSVPQSLNPNSIPSGPRSPSSDRRSPSSGSRSPSSGSRSPSSGSKSPPSGSRSPTSGSRSPSSGSRPPSSGSRSLSPGPKSPSSISRSQSVSRLPIDSLNLFKIPLQLISSLLIPLIPPTVKQNTSTIISPLVNFQMPLTFSTVHSSQPLPCNTNNSPKPCNHLPGHTNQLPNPFNTLPCPPSDTINLPNPCNTLPCPPSDTKNLPNPLNTLPCSPSDTINLPNPSNTLPCPPSDIQNLPNPCNTLPCPPSDAKILPNPCNTLPCPPIDKNNSSNSCNPVFSGNTNNSPNSCYPVTGGGNTNNSPNPCNTVPIDSTNNPSNPCSSVPAGTKDQTTPCNLPPVTAIDFPTPPSTIQPNSTTNILIYQWLCTIFYNELHSLCFNKPLFNPSFNSPTPIRTELDPPTPGPVESIPSTTFTPTEPNLTTPSLIEDDPPVAWSNDPTTTLSPYRLQPTHKIGKHCPLSVHLRKPKPCKSHLQHSTHSHSSIFPFTSDD